MKLTDRDLKKAVSDSIKKGNLKIERIDGKDLEETESAICDICGKEIEDVLDAYSYLIVNDDDMVNVNEKCFCCKKCWNKYILRETEKIFSVKKSRLN